MLALRLVYTFVKYNKLVSFIILLSIALIITLIVGGATGAFRDKVKVTPRNKLIYEDYVQKMKALGKEPLSWRDFWRVYGDRYNPDDPETPLSYHPVSENVVNCLHQFNPKTQAVYVTNKDTDFTTCITNDKECIYTTYKKCMEYKNDPDFNKKTYRNKVICAPNYENKDVSGQCGLIHKYIDGKDKYPIPRWKCINLNDRYYALAHSDGTTVIDKNASEVDLPNLDTCTQYINGATIKSIDNKKEFALSRDAEPMESYNHLNCDPSKYSICKHARRLIGSHDLPEDDLHCLHQLDAQAQGVYLTNKEDSLITCVAGDDNRCIDTTYDTCMSYKDSHKDKKKIVICDNENTPNDMIEQCKTIKQHIG